jgi:uncharacterized protein YbjT (DUF2867 family)
MAAPTILVTGATGKTGRAVVALLRGRGVPVRAAVRSHDARSQPLERLGAEIAVADLLDRGQMTAAMQGVQRAYFLPPFNPRVDEAASVFAEAACEARIESVVVLSQWLASPHHPALLTRQLWAVERMFAALPGIATTIVAPGFFADNYLRLIGFASQLGLLPSLTGQSRNAPPSNEDIARVAVAALLDPAEHEGRFHRPTGPELLSTADMAAILSRVLGRKVRAMPMPVWLFLKAARMQGVSPFQLSGVRYWVEDHKQGAFEFCAPTDHVLQATGRPPEDFGTIARRYAAWPEARRSFGTGLRASVDFMRTPVMPGYNLDRFDRRHGFPAPPGARFAMQDEGWKADRQMQATRGGTVQPPRSGVAA